VAAAKNEWILKWTKGQLLPRYGAGPLEQTAVT
jgi:hypothetical protein